MAEKARKRRNRDFNTGFSCPLKIRGPDD